MHTGPGKAANAGGLSRRRHLPTESSTWPPLPPYLGRKTQHSMREACACAVTSGRTNYLQSYLTRPGSVVGDNAVNRLTPSAVPARSRPVQPLDRPQPRRHRPRHQRPPPWNCSRPTTHPSVRPSAKTESAHSPRFPPLHHLRPRSVGMKQATAHVSALPSQPRP